MPKFFLKMQLPWIIVDVLLYFRTVQFEFALNLKIRVDKSPISGSRAVSTPNGVERHTAQWWKQETIFSDMWETTCNLYSYNYLSTCTKNVLAHQTHDFRTKWRNLTHTHIHIHICHVNMANLIKRYTNDWHWSPGGRGRSGQEQAQDARLPEADSHFYGWLV